MRAWTRYLLPVVLWLCYGLAFTPLHTLFGGAASPLLLVTLVLVGVSGWLWGVWLGVPIAVAAWLGHDMVFGHLATGAWAPPRLLHGPLLFEQVTFVAFGGILGYYSQLRKQLSTTRRMSIQAQFDPLTGLLNRTTLERRLNGIVANAERTGSNFALLFVDLDRFKVVNDTFGHRIGDEVLKQVAAILRASVREGDLVARMGGDEFIIALLDLADPLLSETVARKLVKTLNAPIEIVGKVVSVSASIGIATYPRDGTDVESLTRNADSAMYQVKEAGKNSFHFSTSELQSRQSRRRAVEQALRSALEQNQLRLLYQPQVALGTNNLIGFEALLRWQHPQMGRVSPDEFIPIAEEAGLILPIGHWLLREACHQAQAWNQISGQPVKVAVNVSVLQFQQPAFLSTVGKALRDSGLSPDRLEIEITETVLLKEYELVRQALEQLARVGIRTALDDFGTGYSSLSYLQKLPISSLKIDRSFVSGLTMSLSGYSGSTRPIIEAICALALKLGKKVIAEGVENEVQRVFLSNIGCTHAQGFLFAQPMNPFEVERLLVSPGGRRAEAYPEGELLLLRD